MSDEDLIRAAFEAWSGRDTLDAWLEFGEQWWADDIEMTEDPLWPGAATFKGRRDVAGRFVEYTELFQDGRVTIDAIHRNGQVFVVALRFHVRGAGSGVLVEQPWAWLMHVEDGVSHSIRPYLDLDEALAAAGIAL